LKLKSESGNSVLEFVLFFTIAVGLIVTASAQFETSLRSRSAAIAIAHDFVRELQKSQDNQRAVAAAAEVANVFEIPGASWKVEVSVCDANRSQLVSVKVREVTEFARAHC
jgi:hypothetical protein